jgi:hypothetical protein
MARRIHGKLESAGQFNQKTDIPIPSRSISLRHWHLDYRVLSHYSESLHALLELS